MLTHSDAALSHATTTTASWATLLSHHWYLGIGTTGNLIQLCGDLRLALPVVLLGQRLLQVLGIIAGIVHGVHAGR